MTNFRECPFCGHTNHIVSEANKRFGISCASCLASGMLQDSEEVARKLWNVRVTDKRIELLEAENENFRVAEAIRDTWPFPGERNENCLHNSAIRYRSRLQKIKDRLWLQDVTDEDKVREALEIVEDAFDAPEGSK